MIEELKKKEDETIDVDFSENKSDNNDLMMSSSNFFNANSTMKNMMKDPLMMSMTKMSFKGSIKEEKKKEDIIEREEELKLSIDKFSLDLYEIKCKSDAIFKRRFPNGFQEDNDSIKIIDDSDDLRSTMKDKLIGTPKKNIIIK